jgi:hypothetical protein
MWSNHEPGVRTWHKSEALERINDVRFCGQSGRNMPAVGWSLLTDAVEKVSAKELWN